MRGAASAFAWQFRRQHRWGLTGVAAAIAGLAAIKFYKLAVHGVVEFDTDVGFAFTLLIPLVAAFFFFLAAFTFGLQGDVAARESMYPRRLLTLPVMSEELVRWPMLYGCLAVALLWALVRVVGPWPDVVNAPVVWPGLLAPSLLAWMQALTWMPYPLRGMRIAVAVIWMTVLDGVMLAALEMRAPEGVMLLLLAPQIPLAYLVARYAVRRARSGDVPHWGAGESSRGLTSARPPFASAERAQLWFEWNQFGRSLPLMVAIVVPLELCLLMFSETPMIVWEALVLTLVTPPFMAIFVAATVSKSSASDTYGLTPFMATRPVGNAELIAAKMRAALLSTLAAWAIVLIAIPVAMWLTGTTYVARDAASRLSGAIGTPRAIVAVLIVLALLISSTWKQLVQGLYIGMSGREWAVKGSMFAALALLVILFPIADAMVRNRVAISILLDSLPAIFMTLIVIKLCASVWITRRIAARGILSARAILKAAAGWDVIVFAFFGLLAWILPSIIFPRYVLLLVAILAIPFVRLAAAPLAVSVSRHR